MSKPHTARRRFGQNFLSDRAIIGRIIDAIAPGRDETIVEIGPGQAALTEPLVASGAQIVALEIDHDLAGQLQQQFAGRENFSLHTGDALKLDLAALVAGPFRVVGNLPYNISTPLLFHLLQYRHQINDMVFMLQSEVVDRMVAGPGSKDYGRLSVMMQCHCRLQRLLSVPPTAFRPAPKVMSAVVQLQPLASPLIAPARAASFDKLVRAAFATRRKTLRNNLRGLLDADAIVAAGLDPGCRAETVSVAEFAALAGLLDADAEN